MIVCIANAASILIAFVAQLGERKTEDLKVRGSIPRGGIFFTTIKYHIK